MRIGYKELLTLAVAVSLVAVIVYAAPTPVATDITRGSNLTRNISAQAIGEAVATGGYSTEYNISQNIQTSNWATFWGIVSGQYLLQSVLAGQGNTNYEVYSWSELDNSLTGFVFFANQSNVVWSNLQGCNAVATGSEDGFLGLSPIDNVTNTYQAFVHAELIIGTQTIGANSARGVETISNGGVNFDAVMIESNAGANGIIYTAIIDKDNQNYAGQTADYQIIVPINTATGQRRYYVFASLE